MEGSEKKVKRNAFSMWFGKIETAEDAAYIIKQSAYVAYFMAVLQGVLGYMVAGPMALIDAALYGVIGFFLHKKQSKIAAIALVLVSVLAIINTLSGTGGKNIILAVIVLLTAVASVRATFALEKMKK